jgi:hypothetical protein
MIPRIGQQGNSFIGAGKYYLRDKGADTDRRVALTLTENLPTDDPDMALRFMAYTAMDAENLKRNAEVRRGGSRCERPVLGISLSWHPEQEPEHEHMVWAMNEALKAIGLEEHQRLLVIHNDEPQAHIHAINNLVHPEHGRVAPLKFSKERLAKWAEEYERTHDKKIYCHARVEANARREQETAQLKAEYDRINPPDPNISEQENRRRRKAAKRARAESGAEKPQYPRDKEQALNLKAEITRLFHEAKDGHAFRAAVEKLGFKLAQGDRILLVNSSTGKIHSIARQIEGVKPKEIRAKLAGVELPKVDDARGRQDEGQQKTPATKQEKQDAAQRPAPVAAERQEQPGSLRGEFAAAASPAPPRKKSASKAPQKLRILTAKTINDLQDRHIEELAVFHTKAANQRASLGVFLERQYGQDARALRNEIAGLQNDLDNASAWRTFLRKLTGKLPKMQKSLEDKRRTLENIEMRESESWGGFEATLKEQEAIIRQRQQQEREGLTYSPAPPANQNRTHRQFERAAQDSGAEITQAPAPIRQSGPSRDR